MERTALVMCFLVVVALALGCASEQRYHKERLPEPTSYMARFPDLDQNGNGLVSLNEFETYFPQADVKVFKALDLNEDQHIDRTEWHKFMHAHGSRHKAKHGHSY
jgi:hypothetical protein